MLGFALWGAPLIMGAMLSALVVGMRMPAFFLAAFAYFGFH